MFYTLDSLREYAYQFSNYASESYTYYLSKDALDHVLIEVTSNNTW